MCNYWYDACVNATNQDSNELSECTRARNTICGTLEINDAGEVVTASTRLQASASSYSRLSTSSVRSRTSSSSALPTLSGVGQAPPSSTPGASPPGTSTGTIVGAAVGSIGGLLCLAALIWLCLRQRKQKRRDVAEKQAEYVKAELDGNGVVTHGRYNVCTEHELHHESTTEMHAINSPSELQGDDIYNASELQAQTTQPELDARVQ
jgi:hypothetical protein